jgi:hypothetical protein
MFMHPGGVSRGLGEVNLSESDQAGAAAGAEPSALRPGEQRRHAKARATMKVWKAGAWL